MDNSFFLKLAGEKLTECGFDCRDFILGEGEFDEESRWKVDFKKEDADKVELVSEEEARQFFNARTTDGEINDNSPLAMHRYVFSIEHSYRQDFKKDFCLGKNEMVASFGRQIFPLDLEEGFNNPRLRATNYVALEVFMPRKAYFEINTLYGKDFFRTIDFFARKEQELTMKDPVKRLIDVLFDADEVSVIPSKERNDFVKDLDGKNLLNYLQTTINITSHVYKNGFLDFQLKKFA